jgi:hypothetical protein
MHMLVLGLFGTVALLNQDPLEEKRCMTNKK